MKTKILLLAFSLFSLLAFGQGFPMTNTGYWDYEDYLQTEGVSYPVGGPTTSFIWTGQSGSGGQAVTGPFGGWNIDNAYYYKSITLTASRLCHVQPLSYYTTSSVGVSSGSVIIGPGASTPVDIGFLKKLDQTGIAMSVIDVIEANPQHTPATVSQAGLYVTKSTTTPVNTTIKTYSITVTLTNLSGSSSSGSIVVTDSLPAGCEYFSASGTGFTFSQAGKKYTATTSDVIANNGTKTYTLTVRGTMSLTLGAFGAGYSIPNDNDLTLQPIVWAGTSITNGTGITSYKQNYTGLFDKWLDDNLNIKVRTLNRAISSSQTNIMEDYRVWSNWYYPKMPPRLLVIEHGVNDVAQGILTATSVANVTAIIQDYRKKYPTCYILILAPFPAAAYETGLATYRTAMSTLVSGLSANDRKYVKYIPGTGSAWNATTQGGTYTTDGIHVNAAGRVLILNAITSHITTNGWTFPLTGQP